MYTQPIDSLSDGVPHYHSKGRTFKNKAVTFKLYRSHDDEKTKKWRLIAAFDYGGQNVPIYTACLDAQLTQIKFRGTVGNWRLENKKWIL
jgi:hypothetical protein